MSRALGVVAGPLKMMLPMVRQAHHEDEHKLTMRFKPWKALGLILSLSKDEAISLDAASGGRP
jgi:hypothetical protein